MKNGRTVGSIPKSILYSPFLLYFIFIIAAGNIVLFMTQKEYLFVVLFVVVGILTSFFSKNMVVILTISIVFANVLKYGTKIRVEGFEEEKEEKEEINEGYKDDENEDDEEKKKKKEKKDKDKKDEDEKDE